MWVDNMVQGKDEAPEYMLRKKADGSENSTTWDYKSDMAHEKNVGLVNLAAKSMEELLSMEEVAETIPYPSSASTPTNKKKK